MLATCGDRDDVVQPIGNVDLAKITLAPSCERIISLQYEIKVVTSCDGDGIGHQRRGDITPNDHGPVAQEHETVIIARRDRDCASMRWRRVIKPAPADNLPIIAQG